MRLHVKFQRVSVALKNWSKAILGNNKILLKAVSQLIGILDVVQDYRQLSELEVRLKRDLKFRLLGLTAVEKLHAKQTSRISSIRASEANSKLFFLQANGRRRKNYIHSLMTKRTSFLIISATSLVGRSHELTLSTGGSLALPGMTCNTLRRVPQRKRCWQQFKKLQQIKHRGQTVSLGVFTSIAGRSSSKTCC
jgi:hypothetical protein